MELYPLGAKDIEAIAKSRASRSMPQSIKNWLYGGFGVFVVGIIYWMFKGGWVALGIMVIGAAIAWYSTTLSDKRRKAVMFELKKAWRAEQEKQVGGKA